MSHFYQHHDIRAPLPCDATLFAGHGHHVWCPFYAPYIPAASSSRLPPPNFSASGPWTSIPQPGLGRRQPVQLPPVSETDNVPTPERSNMRTPPSVHPFLARPTVPVIYDIRFPPSTLRFPRSSPYHRYSHSDLVVPLTPSRPRLVRIISKQFPWTFDVDYTERGESYSVTCLDVLTALHDALQETLADHEWGLADRVRKERMLRARSRRMRAERRLTLLKRVDWLGSHSLFKGLEKDEMFARGRMCPGTLEVSETWVVKFGRVTNIE